MKQATTFAALNAALDAQYADLAYELRWDIVNALGEAADNAVHSEVLVGDKFVFVGSNDSPLFNQAALDSLETVMACNVGNLPTERNAKLAGWLLDHGFKF